MAKNHDNIPRTLPKLFKQPAFFKSGLLQYRLQGHTITLSNGYYRCSLNSKQKCALHTRQIPHETLERAFARYVQNYSLPRETATKLLRKLFKENIGELLVGADEELDIEEELFDATIAAAKQEKKIRESDIKTAAEALNKIHQADYPLLLMGIAMGTLTTIANPQLEAEMARSFSFLARKIELNNDGTIYAIEFQRWGWYTLNLFNHHTPNYLSKAQAHKIKLLNGRDELQSLTLAKAALHFGLGNVKEAMNMTMNTMHDLILWMRKSIEYAFNIQDPIASGQAALAMLEKMKNDPTLHVMTKIMNAVNIKPRRLNDI